MLKKLIATVLIGIITANVAYAEFVAKLPLPRYASLRSKSANMRSGPAKKYPILWEYSYKSMPVQIIAEHDTWRKVITPNGEKGWFHVSLLSGVRTAMFYNKASANVIDLNDLPLGQTILYRKPSHKSFPVARVADHSVGTILKCHDDWCKIRIHKVQGWTPTIHLWGVDENEEIK